MKGRKNDMYISVGENIYPQEVEAQLEEFIDISKAVVLSVKDDKWGQCGIAFVTTTNESLSVAHIREFLKTNLVAFKHPKYIFILDEIPLTSLGKVSRKQLYSHFNTIKSEQ
jgi:fatty-acyl-CoA synthase